MTDARKITNLFLERVEDGYYNLEDIIRSFCVYLSEDEIRQFVIDEQYMDQEEIDTELWVEGQDD